MSRTFGDRRREGTILASSKLLTASAGLLSASSSWGRVRVPWSRRPLRLISALITRPRLLPTRPGFRRRSSPGSIGRSAVGATARPGGALKGDRAPLLGLPLLPARSVPPARWGPPRPGCRPPKLAAPTGAVPLLFAPRLRLDRLSTGEATLSARTTFAAPSAGSRPDRDDPAPGLVAPSFALPRRLAPADRPCVTRTRSPYRDGLVPAPDAPAPPALPLPSSASPAPSGRSLPASTPRPPRGGPIGHCTRNLFDWSPRAARHRNTFCPGALRNEGLPSCPTAPFSLRRPRLHLPATPQGNGFGITRRPRRSIPGREPISALITPTRADGPSRSERRLVPISALITPVLRPTPSLDRLHRPRTAAAPPCADCPGRRLPVLRSSPVGTREAPALRPRAGVATGVASAPPTPLSFVGLHGPLSAAEGRIGAPFATLRSSTRSRDTPPASRTRHEPSPGQGEIDAAFSFLNADGSPVLSEGALLLARTHEARTATAGAARMLPGTRHFCPVRPTARLAEKARASASPSRQALLLAGRVSRAGTDRGQPTEVGSIPRRTPIGGRRHPSPPEPSRRSLGVLGPHHARVGRPRKPARSSARREESRGATARRAMPEASRTAGASRRAPILVISALMTLGARLRPERTTSTANLRCAPARTDGGLARLDRPTRRLGSRTDPTSALLAKRSAASAARAGGGAGAGPPADRPPDARKGCRSRPPFGGRVRPLEGRGLALGPWGLPDRGQPPGDRLPGCTCPTSRIGEDPAPLCGPSPWPRRDQRRRRPLEFDRLDSRTRWPRPRTFVRRRLCRWDLIEIKSSFSDLV